MFMWRPRYSTTDHWILKTDIQLLAVFFAVGAAERKKNANCHINATFEGSFLCFQGQKRIECRIPDIQFFFQY